MNAMNARAMLWPVLALVALTFVVMIVMYRRRVREIRARRIHPQSLASALAMSTKLEDVSASDNYRNLHEAPTLFYVAALAVAVAGMTDALMVGLAWAYVAARVVHSAIHVTYNRVMHRFQAFLASQALLALLWLAIAWRLVAAAVG